MSSDIELKRKSVPSVECRTPLMKGNQYTEYDTGMFLYRSLSSQLSSIDQLQELFWETGKSFDLASSSGQVSLFKAEYHGLFDIPWVITAGVLHENVFLSYHVRLKRPDLTLQYVILQRKSPEFYINSVLNGDISGGPWMKNRTRIDGLPIYLRIEESKDDELVGGVRLGPGKVSKVRLFTTDKESPEQLQVNNKELFDKNRIIFEGKSYFLGSWIERWYFSEVGNDLLLENVEVFLKGIWNPKRVTSSNINIR